MKYFNSATTTAKITIMLSDEKYEVLKSNADLIITLDTNLITM